jgi:hypothetical protein
MPGTGGMPNTAFAKVVPEIMPTVSVGLRKGHVSLIYS